MIKSDQSLIAVHDALRVMGITRAFLHQESGGWLRYVNTRLAADHFAIGDANRRQIGITLIGRAKARAPK